MKARKITKARVERIHGKFAVISVCADKKNILVNQKNMLLENKKYIILLRNVLPPETREGNSFNARLGRFGIEWASPNLENAIRRAKLINEITDYMEQPRA